MRAILTFFLFIAASTSAVGDELISRDNARAILSLSQASWNQQVRQAASAKLSTYSEDYDGTLRQIIRGDNWELSTAPYYGGLKSAPSSVELQIGYSNLSPAFALSPSESDRICARVFEQIRVEFSLLCTHKKTAQELRYTFVISKPGSRRDVDDMNAKGVYTLNQQKLESELKPPARDLIPVYWAQLDEWAARSANSKSDLAKAAVIELPVICSKLVTAYALASGKPVVPDQEERWDRDFNADFCVKATIHRRFPQPEFENPKIVEMLCNKQRAYEFNLNLCRRAGLLK